MKLTEKLDFTYLLISGRVCFLERNGGKIVKAVGLVYDSLGVKKHLEEQKRQINQYCSDMKIELKEIYVGTKDEMKDRREFYHSFIEEKMTDAEVFVIPSITRISRHFDEFKGIVDEFKQHGIEVVTLTTSEIMFLDSNNPMYELARGAAAGEIDLSGGYEEEDYEEEITDIPYGYRLEDGKLVVNESEKEVVVWVFEAVEYYMENVPEVLVQRIQRDSDEKYGVKLNHDEAREKVSFDMVKEYITIELNVRIYEMFKEHKKIRECLEAPLSEKQQKLIADRILGDGEEYREKIVDQMNGRKTARTSRPYEMYYGKYKEGKGGKPILDENAPKR